MLLHRPARTSRWRRRATMSSRADDEGAGRLGHAEAAAAPATASTAAPGVLQAIITGFVSQSEGSERGEAHAAAERPHPRRRCAGVAPSALRRLEDDRHRAGEADQHGDEAGRHGREETSETRASVNARAAGAEPPRGLVRSRSWSPARRRGWSAGAGSRPPRWRCGACGEQLLAPGAMPPPMVGMTMSRDRK